MKKLGLSLVSAATAAQMAMAEGLTVGADGTISGAIDTAPVASAAGIIITALAGLIVLKWVISFVRRA